MEQLKNNLENTENNRKKLKKNMEQKDRGKKEIKKSKKQNLSNALAEDQAILQKYPLWKLFFARILEMEKLTEAERYQISWKRWFRKYCASFTGCHHFLDKIRKNISERQIVQYTHKSEMNLKLSKSPTVGLSRIQAKPTLNRKQKTI